MKLNFGRRLVLILYWLLSVIVCVLAVALCTWPQGVTQLFGELYGAIGKLQADIIGAVLLGVYVLLTVLSAATIFPGSHRGDRGFITVDSSESGKTRIAVGAVEQMIRQAAHGVEGISEMKSSIVNHEDSISIKISVVLASGAHVPTVTMNLQRAIRSYIELNCGVAVGEVCVSVHSLESGETGDRRSWKKSTPVPVVTEENSDIQENADVPETSTMQNVDSVHEEKLEVACVEPGIAEEYSQEEASSEDLSEQDSTAEVVTDGSEDDESVNDVTK